jgi:hypothetical protein
MPYIFSEYFKNYSKILNKVISLAKKSTYDRQITTSKNKARATWNIIDTELSKKNKIERIQALTVNGTINSDPHFLVKIFNKHYSEVADSIYTKIKENVVNSMKHYDHMTFMSKAFKSPFFKLLTTKTSSREIEKIINSLKTICTQGYDEISNKLLKACKNFNSVPLIYICNKMLFDGVYPEVKICYYCSSI